MKILTKSSSTWFLLAIIALAGMLNVLIATRGGVGAQSDSAFYIGVARNLSAGQGYGLTRPYTGFEFFSLFPPLYSLVLAGLAAISPDLIEAARWLNAILFGLTIALSGGFFIWKWNSRLAGILIAVLLAFSPSMIAAHAWLLSEPLFYFFGTVALLSLMLSLSGRGWSWLVLSACATALAALDRYAGLALVLCGWIALFFQAGTRFSHRIKRMALFGAISLAPTAAWLWIVREKSATIAGRELFAPDEILPRLVNLAGPLKQTIIEWVPFSDQLSFISDPHQYKPFWIITILAAIVLAALFIVAIRRSGQAGQSIAAPLVLLRVFVVFMACHLLVFVGATLFLTASPAAGDRNFAPLLFAFFFIMAALLVVIQRIYQNDRRIIPVAAVTTILLIGIQIGFGIRAVSDYPADGLGYNTIQERQAPIYTAIRNLPEELLIVCNNPNVVFFHTNRGAYPIIELHSSNPEWDFPVYGQGRNRTDQGQLAFEEGLAALVLLPDAYWEFQFRYGDQTDQRLVGLTDGLYLYYEGQDGKIYLKDETVLR